MSPGPERQGGAAAGGCDGGFRASHADRDHVIDMLKAAYVQGRLSKDEFDLRVSQAFGSRTWAELDALTRDIPRLARVAPAPGRCHRPSRAIPVFVTAIASIGLVLLALFTAPSQAMRPASSPPARFTIPDAERRVQCGKPGRQPSAFVQAIRSLWLQSAAADRGHRAPGCGTVSGTFIAMGGPVPVHGRPMMVAPLPGRIIGIGSAGRRVQVTAGRSGTFRLSLPPGSYRLIGYSPHVTVGHGEMRCGAIHPVQVRVGRVLSHVKVVCALP
jgi:hypothetical protein